MHIALHSVRLGDCDISQYTLHGLYEYVLLRLIYTSNPFITTSSSNSYCNVRIDVRVVLMQRNYIHRTLLDVYNFEKYCTVVRNNGVSCVQQCVHGESGRSYVLQPIVLLHNGQVI